MKCEICGVPTDGPPCTNTYDGGPSCADLVKEKKGDSTDPAMRPELAAPQVETTGTNQEQNTPVPLTKPTTRFFTPVGTIDLSEHGHTIDGHHHPATAEGFDQFANEIERRAQELDDTTGLVDALIKTARQNATVYQIAASLDTPKAQMLISASTTGQVTGHRASLATLTRKGLLHETQKDDCTVYCRTPLGVSVARARARMDSTQRTDTLNQELDELDQAMFGLIKNSDTDQQNLRKTESIDPDV